MKSKSQYLASRRKNKTFKWQRLLLLIFIPFLIAGYARFIEPYMLVMKNVNVDIRMEVPDCTVVFFSDTHFGKNYSQRNIERIVDRINRSNPDVVIFGGDFLDNYARDRKSLDLDYIQSELQRIQSSYGKFAIWGNHDYGGGAVRVYHDLMTGGGFRVLENESVLVEALNMRVFGYDDYLLGETDLSLYRIKSQQFNLIAAHEPVVADFIENTGENLFLAGHTHGGQIGVPLIRKKVTPRGSGSYVKGLYSQKEIGTETSMQMYVSSGIGTAIYPVRFLNVPEIVEFHLSSGLSGKTH